MNFVRINGYLDYVIHPCGTILRIYKNGNTKERKHLTNTNGYTQISLWKNGKEKMFQVHRLLALHFIPNPENKPCVDHIRGKHMGNSLDNLRWLTHKENSNAFRINPAQLITKGYISKNGNSWIWRYLMSGKRKTKTMKSLEALEKYREEKLISLIPPS